MEYDSGCQTDSVPFMKLWAHLTSTVAHVPGIPNERYYHL